MVSLADVLERRPPDVIVDPTHTYPFAGVYCFGRGVFRGQQRQGSEFSYRSLTQVHEGDFVYPKLMAWEGAFGVVPDTCDGCYVSPEFPVFRVRTDRLISRFLGYYFRIPSVWETMAGGSIGTNVRRRRLHPDDLLRRLIALPSLPEQRRIVAKLDQLSAKVKEARALRATRPLQRKQLWPPISTTSSGPPKGDQLPNGVRSPIWWKTWLTVHMSRRSTSRVVCPSLRC